MMFRPLRHGHIHSTNGFKTAVNMEQKVAFSKLLSIYQGTPIAILPLEQYLMEVDNLVKSCYRRNNIDDAGRAAIEREMFLSCSIPEILMPAVTELLTSKMETLMDSQDPGKIHVHDVAWLGLTDDKRTKQWQEKYNLDVIKKMPIAANAKLRRCPRCASVMEDVSIMGAAGVGGQAAPPQQQQWVYQSQKTCICFNSWVVPET
jgi:mediator of RNA polymerase II transcription subunit 16